MHLLQSYAFITKEGVNEAKAILTGLLLLGTKASKAQPRSQPTTQASSSSCAKTSTKAKAFVLGSTKEPWGNKQRIIERKSRIVPVKCKTLL